MRKRIDSRSSAAAQHAAMAKKKKKGTGTAASLTVADEAAVLVTAALAAKRKKKAKAVVVDDEEAQVLVTATPVAKRKKKAKAVVVDDEEAQVLVTAAPVALMATPVGARHDQSAGGTSCKSRESSLSMAAVSDQEFEELLVPTELAATLKVKDIRKSSDCFVQVQQTKELTEGATETEVYLVGNDLQIASARQAVAQLVEAAMGPVPGGLQLVEAPIGEEGAVLLAQAIDSNGAAAAPAYKGPFRDDEATLGELSRVSGQLEKALLTMPSASLRSLMKDSGVKKTQQQIILREVAARNDPRAGKKKGGGKYVQGAAMTAAERAGGMTPSQFEISREAAHDAGLPRRRAGGPTHMPGPGEKWRGTQPGEKSGRFNDEDAARAWAEKNAKSTNAGELNCCVIS